MKFGGIWACAKHSIDDHFLHSRLVTTTASCHSPEAKEQGGSGALNLAFWKHPSPTGINNWAELDNLAWERDGLVSHLVKAETLASPQEIDSLQLIYAISSDHGSNGPVVAGYSTEFDSFQTTELR